MNANALTIDNEATEVETRREVADAPSVSPMISTLERIMMDPTIPMERVERAIAMYDHMQDRAREDEKLRAQKAYFAAMSKCQEELPVVIKNRKNEHTRSLYADLAAIEEQAMPVIHKHGFGATFQPAGYNDKGELQIKWKIVHAEGHSESDIAGIPVDNAGSQGKVNKTGTQAFGSTATYGRRYLLCMLFNISTGDDRDGNRVEDTSATITTAQRDELQGLIEKVGWDVPGFCEWAKIEALPDLESRLYPKAKQLLETRARMKGAAQ